MKYNVEQNACTSKHKYSAVRLQISIRQKCRKSKTQSMLGLLQIRGEQEWLLHWIELQHIHLIIIYVKGWS